MTAWASIRDLRLCSGKRRTGKITKPLSVKDPSRTEAGQRYRIQKKRLISAMSSSIEKSRDGARMLVDLTRTEALHLASTVSYGRVVFTRNALPAIRPVNHVLDDDEIIIRTRLSAKLAIAVDPGTVVAYEVDQIDPVQRRGWSVVVTGVARQIIDPDRLFRYEELLVPWVDLTTDVAVGIQTELVTGFRFGRTG